MGLTRRPSLLAILSKFAPRQHSLVLKCDSRTANLLLPEARHFLNKLYERRCRCAASGKVCFWTRRPWSPSRAIRAPTDWHRSSRLTVGQLVCERVHYKVPHVVSVVLADVVAAETCYVRRRVSLLLLRSDIGSPRSARASHLLAVWRLAPVWRAASAMPAPDPMQKTSVSRPLGANLALGCCDMGKASFAAGLGNSQLGGDLPIYHPSNVNNILALNS